MFTKLYEKTIQYIKKNLLFIIILIIAIFLSLYKLPYYIYIGGGTIDINNNIKIDNETSSKGSYNFAYVSEIEATIPTYLLSKIFSDWEVVSMDELTLTEDETVSDLKIRDTMFLNDANQSAIELAYKKANKEFKITKTDLTIIYIDSTSNNNLKIGDIITKIDNITTNSLEDITNAVNKRNVNDKLDIEVIRNNKTISTYAYIKEDEKTKNKVIGISLMMNRAYETNPKVTLDFKSNESGPSGGLMLAISIYDKLIKEDLTNGLKIVGTGTISTDGTVGEIGGVNYKLKGAVKGKADVFIVPKGNNYNECIKIKKEKGYDIKIIGVSTFDESINALKSLK